MNSAALSSIPKSEMKEFFLFFFVRSFLDRRSLWRLDCFTGQSPGMWTKRVGHFYPGGPGIAREMAKSKPELLNEGLGGGWARGPGGWAWGLGQDLAPGWLVPFNFCEMGAVLIEEAGCEGLQCGMGQQGRPSVDKGGCHGMLEKAGCLSGFCVRKELDKTGCFFTPSASCFDAEDDEATAAAVHELGVCTLLPASGFNQCCSCILPGLRRGCPSRVRGETMVVSTASWVPPQLEGRSRSLRCGDRLVCGCGQGSVLSVRCLW